MKSLVISGDSVELTTVNYSGNKFSDFFVRQSPQSGPGWYVFGRNSEKYGIKPDGTGAYTMLCARPNVKSRRHPHYTCTIRSGWKTKRAAMAIAEYLNSLESV